MSIYCPTRDAAHTLCCPDAGASTNDRFATMPVVGAARVPAPLSEEALHTSFEQAISGRLLTVNRQLGRPHAAHAITAPVQRREAGFVPAAWRLRLTIAGLLCMSALLGFDLMGLLFILHMH